MKSDTDPTKLRVAIAEKVGWTFDLIEDIKCWRLPSGEATNSSPPDYPSDPAAALSLCDWMNSKGWTPSMNMTIGGEWRCIFDGLRFQHIATAPTLPLAICLAFAKALNLEIE